MSRLKTFSSNSDQIHFFSSYNLITPTQGVCFQRRSYLKYDFGLVDFIQLPHSEQAHYINQGIIAFVTKSYCWLKEIFLQLSCDQQH